MEMIFKDVIDRLSKILKTDSLKDIALALDIPYNTLRQKNTSSLKPEKVIFFAVKHNINYEWLAFGIGAKYKNQKEINSNIHNLYALSNGVSQALNSLQAEIIKATHPDSKGGTAIVESERESIKFNLEALAFKLKETAELAGFELNFEIKVKED